MRETKRPPACLMRRKPSSVRKKQRSHACARSANESARQTSSASSSSSSAKKRRHGEPRSGAGNRLPPSLPPRRQRPRERGAAVALSPLRLPQLARPHVPKVPRRPAARRGYLAVAALRRVGVRGSRQRAVALRRVVGPLCRQSTRNNRKRRRTRTMGSRLRRTFGSLRGYGGSSRIPFFFFRLCE